MKEIKIRSDYDNNYKKWGSLIKKDKIIVTMSSGEPTFSDLLHNNIIGVAKSVRKVKNALSWTVTPVDLILEKCLMAYFQSGTQLRLNLVYKAKDGTPSHLFITQEQVINIGRIN